MRNFKSSSYIGAFCFHGNVQNFTLIFPQIWYEKNCYPFETAKNVQMGLGVQIYGFLISSLYS